MKKLVAILNVYPQSLKCSQAMAAQVPDACKLEAEVALTSETNEQSGK